jgi:hypothetical protein
MEEDFKSRLRTGFPKRNAVYKTQLKHIMHIRLGRESREDTNIQATIRSAVESIYS